MVAFDREGATGERCAVSLFRTILLSGFSENALLDIPKQTLTHASVDLKVF